MTDLKVVAGRMTTSKSDQEQIIEVLEEVLGDLREGRDVKDTMLLSLTDTSDIETFNTRTLYIGRASSVLGFLEVSKQTVLGDMLDD